MGAGRYDGERGNTRAVSRLGRRHEMWEIKEVIARFLGVKNSGLRVVMPDEPAGGPITVWPTWVEKCGTSAPSWSPSSADAGTVNS